MPRLTFEQVRDAIDRLKDEKLIPLQDLDGTELVVGDIRQRVSARQLERWGKTGRFLVHLDIMRDRAAGRWVTSREALERFTRETAWVPVAGTAYCGG